MAKKATTSAGTATAQAGKAPGGNPVKRDLSTASSVEADKAVANGAKGGNGKREVTHQMIAERAYELYTQGAPGGPDDHWKQAEAELRGV